MNSRKRRRELQRARNIHWQDVWEIPLRLDVYGDQYAYSQNDVMALTFEASTEYMAENARRIVRIINGEERPRPGEEWVNSCVDFFTHDENYEEEIEGWNYVFCVRGWGHLTGTSALHLPEKEAERIQDEFVMYIIDKLAGK